MPPAHQADCAHTFSTPYSESSGSSWLAVIHGESVYILHVANATGEGFIFQRAVKRFSSILLGRSIELEKSNIASVVR